MLLSSIFIRNNQLEKDLGSSQLNLANEGKYIFLIDDDASMRDVLRKILEFQNYLVRTFSSALDFLKNSIDVSPAVIITDMRMPDMSGIELQAELLKRGRQIPIIFISGQASVAQSIVAMKQGAIEFLQKPFEYEDLLNSIRKGHELDECYMQNSAQKKYLEACLKKLSPREREVFELLALGYNNAELLAKLQISLPTVKQYKSEVMRKLSLGSLAELIRLNKHSS